MSVSSGREQDTETWNIPTAFVFIPFIIRGPLCTGLPTADNLILVGVIIVCADAGNSHIFREIRRGDITLDKKHK